MIPLVIPAMVSLTEVPLVVAAPVVIVFNTAAISFPVTYKELLPIMIRLNRKGRTPNLEETTQGGPSELD